MTDPLRDRLTAVFREVFGDDALVLSDDMTAAHVKGWDSLNHVRLMLTVQRAFRVRLTAMEVSQLQSVGALVELLRSKTGDDGIPRR